jgi:Lar family restriction alleviation protein
MKLSPCPFCGGEAERIELDDEANFGGTCIGCKKCGASSPVHFEFKENLESSWNERKDGVAAERKAISEEARRYASHYPQSSDGRNTFIMLAEWIDQRALASDTRDANLIATSGPEK